MTENYISLWKITAVIMKKSLLLTLILVVVSVCIYAKPKNAGTVTVTREFYIENGESRSGFAFVNEYNYEVRIDIGLYFNGDAELFGYSAGSCVESKVITLKPKESYLWQCGSIMVRPDGRVNRCFPEYFYVKCTSSKVEDGK